MSVTKRKACPLSDQLEASKKVRRKVKEELVYDLLLKRQEIKKSCFSLEVKKLQGKEEESAVMIGQNSKFPVLHKRSSQSQEHIVKWEIKNQNEIIVL